MQPLEVERTSEIQEVPSSGSSSSINFEDRLQQILNAKKNQDPYSIEDYLYKIPGEDEHAPIKKVVYPVFNFFITAFAMLIFCFSAICTCSGECVCAVANRYCIGETLSAILALILEAIAAALVQKSKNRPKYVLAAMLVCVVSVLISGCDFIRRHRKGTKWRWFTFADWFGIIMAILQLGTSTFDYFYVLHKTDFKFNFSTIPLAFAAFVVTAKFVKCCHPRRPAYQMVFCPHGTVELKVLEEQQHRHIRFACVACQLHVMHPEP